MSAVVPALNVDTGSCGLGWGIIKVVHLGGQFWGLAHYLVPIILFDMSHGAGDLWKQTDARASLGMGGSLAPFVLDNWSSSLSGFKFQGFVINESPPI